MPAIDRRHATFASAKVTSTVYDDQNPERAQVCVAMHVKGNQASSHVYLYLTSDEMRSLAATLVESADIIDEQAKLPESSVVDVPA